MYCTVPISGCLAAAGWLSAPPSASAALGRQFHADQPGSSERRARSAIGFAKCSILWSLQCAADRFSCLPRYHRRKQPLLQLQRLRPWQTALARPDVSDLARRSRRALRWWDANTDALTNPDTYPHSLHHNQQTHPTVTPTSTAAAPAPPRRSLGMVIFVEMAQDPSARVINQRLPAYRLFECFMTVSMTSPSAAMQIAINPVYWQSVTVPVSSRGDSVPDLWSLSDAEQSDRAVPGHVQ